MFVSDTINEIGLFGFWYGWSIIHQHINPIGTFLWCHKMFSCLVTVEKKGFAEALEIEERKEQMQMLKL